jgi:hypothetical protein
MLIRRRKAYRTRDSSDSTYGPRTGWSFGNDSITTVSGNGLNSPKMSLISSRRVCGRDMQKRNSKAKRKRV